MIGPGGLLLVIFDLFVVFSFMGGVEKTIKLNLDVKNNYKRSHNKHC